MNPETIIAEYRKAFGNQRFTDIRGPQWSKQRTSFLSAVYCQKVAAKDSGIARVEFVLYQNLPCGWGKECFAVVARNLNSILSV